ncbi:hypothetical protein FRX31_028001 [Thalictrum thalictroides]|uniref:Uncharacterized protein n=1 Tax=Thalictrum thalictroides TaxID=46969 RepID=A0A7J6VDK5_THATH|nr:hypothetical protein FRX31_028001 [Thalictrum thalictroides]
MAEIMNEKKRVRDDSEESDADSPVTKRFHNDFLDILDDSEAIVDRNEATQDLASVMKSFEEEISMSKPLTELTSDSGESQPDLGYLFEASDDELGLPPAFSCGTEEEEHAISNDEDKLCVSSDVVGLNDQIWRFEDEIPNYEFGIGDNFNSDFLTLDGLFDYSDVYSCQNDFSDFSYRPESLPAL